MNFLPVIGNTKLKNITPFIVESWQTKRIKNNISRATVNRNVSALKSALSKCFRMAVN